MFRLVVCAVLLIGLIAPAVAQTPLRLVSWNIANLTHAEGVELRPGIGTERRAADFATLKRYADDLEADVIAPQEIGTLEAAQFLFPEPDYTVYPSEQMQAGNHPSNEGDIYTAIAVRNRSDIVVVEQEDLNELAVIHAPDQRHTRSGAALLIDVAGRPLWVMSVHLKSSCSGTRSLSTSTNAHCVTFWSQRVPLRAWIAAREADGEDFVVMGDFNRRFRQYGAEDEFWKALSADGASQPRLVAHPLSVTRLCPTRLGTSTQPIDWIMLSDGLASDFAPLSFWETRYTFADVQAHGGRSRSRLSDHCPIQIDLVF